VEAALRWVGEKAEGATYGAGYTLSLLFQSAVFSRGFWRRRKIIIDNLFLAIIGSLPLVSVTALFIGMIIALQTGIELTKYGQAQSLGYVVPITVARGMGPVFTAIAVTALIGSTISAQIGTMRVSEEIDALEVMGINPVSFLVMPWVVALAIALPILTVYTDLIGTLGGAAVAHGKFGVSVARYLDNARDILKLKDIYGGLFKSFCYSLIISGTACSEGMRAGAGAQGVGYATLKTVVLSFLYILIFDYILTWLLYSGPF
jgi:phospholipid/cholesterol/gamma-HCH transport system permease protein